MTKRFPASPVAVALCALALLLPASRASAGLQLDQWKGHIAFGYARVFSDSLAPSGSLSFAGGVEYPLDARWRLGPSLSFNLLGSSLVRRGSVTAELDYSLFEAALLATWLPPRGPFGRISLGPGVANARVDLAVGGGGAAFGDLTVGETRPEFALDADVLPRHMTVVAPALELGVRVIPVTQATWTLFTARFAIQF